MSMGRPGDEGVDDHLYDCDDFDYEPDPLEEAEAECGLGRNGQCSLAGTEHCDFVCPFRDSEDFAGSAAWHAKRRGKRQA
jgi:hypothetical protein